MKRLILGALLALLTWMTAFPALAWHRPPVVVRILTSDGKELSKFNVPSANNATGVSVAVADLGTDGVPEIVLGNGLGNPPIVRVVRQDGSEIGKFEAYAPSMGVGVNVTVCDVTGDGVKEIITAPQRGGGPHVRLFDNTGNLFHEGFFAYETSFREGVNLACGDLDGDANAELVTLPATGGAPYVKIWKWDGKQMNLSKELFPFDAANTSGLIGVVHDQTLTVFTQRGGSVQSKNIQWTTSGTTTSEQNYMVEGTEVTSAFVNAGNVYLTTASNPQVFSTSTLIVTKLTSDSGSVTAAAGDFDNDGKEEWVVVPGRPLFSEKYASTPKAIVVDISDQRLYAYENGILTNTFLVSTGAGRHPTPLGETKVLAKIYKVRYQWSYGPNNPNNYDLGIVPYNLRIFPHIYIHYAPWHKNFGHVMSHGCVNVGLENAKWIYEWGEENIPVTVQS